MRAQLNLERFCKLQAFKKRPHFGHDKRLHDALGVLVFFGFQVLTRINRIDRKNESKIR